MSIIAAAIFIGTPFAVWDSDGPIWCEEAPKIRTSSIAAREIDGTFQSHHPCSRASGEASRDVLVDLLGRRTGRWKSGHITIAAPPMRCCQEGRSFDRVVASCTLSDSCDLGRAMLATSTVLPWD